MKRTWETEWLLRAVSTVMVYYLTALALVLPMLDDHEPGDYHNCRPPPLLPWPDDIPTPWWLPR